MNVLEKALASIEELNQDVMAEVQAYEDTLTKPPGSLGVLEKIAIQLGGITGTKIPEVGKKAVVVMAGDHGVVDEGVSAFPKEVTPQMVQNICNGGAAINVLARHSGADVIVVDVGVAFEMDFPHLITSKVKFGTANMAKGPAMSRDEAVQALEVGVQMANQLKSQGYQMLATGEMGIGNTTPSSALISVFLNIPVTEVTGRGTGLSTDGVFRKAAVIQKAIQCNQPNPIDPIDVLAKVGGLEIAGLAGLIIGAAANHLPIVIDGFISSVAALVASKIAPISLDYMIASHCSAEFAHRKLLQSMNLKPVLELEMRLGEGTGAALAFHVIEAAVKIVKEMATFESAGVTNK